MVQDLFSVPIWCHFCPRLGGSGFRSQLVHFFPGPGIWDLGSGIGYRGPDPKSERAGSGTLTHPVWDKIGTKWVAIKDFGTFSAGFYAEFRRESL